MVHYPLCDWISSLVQKLTAFSSSLDGELENLLGLLNQASLIESFLGNYEKAYRLCEHHITLICANDSLRREHWVSAIQQWVNVGRLHRIQGDYDLAVNHFKETYTLLNRGYFQFKNFTIEPSDWKCIIDVQPDFDFFLWTVYVVECSTAFLESNRFFELSNFIRDTERRAPDWLSNLLLEGKILTDERLFRYDDVCDLVKLTQGVSILNKIVFRIHLCVSLFNLGKLSEAELISEEIAVYLEAATDKIPDKQLIKLIYVYARALHLIGRKIQSSEYCLKGLRLSDSQRDQRYCILFLNFLITTLHYANEDREPELRKTFNFHIKHCYYKDLLSKFSCDREADDSMTTRLALLRKTVSSALRQESEKYSILA